VAVELGQFSWQRMIEAVQAVHDRALRGTVMDVVFFIDDPDG